MVKLLVILLLYIVPALTLHAQIDVDMDNSAVPPPFGEEVSENQIFTIVEQMPEFPGGQAGLMKYIVTIQYPAESRKKIQEGTVYIQVIIAKDGKIIEPRISRSSGFEELDQAALAHIAAMPNWKPGMQNGKPVMIKYLIPIKFKLE